MPESGAHRRQVWVGTCQQYFWLLTIFIRFSTSAYSLAWDMQCSWPGQLFCPGWLIKKDFCVLLSSCFFPTGTHNQVTMTNCLWLAVFIVSNPELPSQAVGAWQGSCQLALPSVCCVCSQAPEEWLICKGASGQRSMILNFSPQKEPSTFSKTNLLINLSSLLQRYFLLLFIYGTGKDTKKF